MIMLPKTRNDCSFANLLNEISQCCRCHDILPHEPRPVVRGLPSARILIISQAPGLKVHETGLSFNDPSGDRLRAWMGIDRELFYDETKIAIVPMGLCFPGRDAYGCDLPPIKACAPYWHPQIMPFFPEVKLTLLVGSYAQKFYLKDEAKKSLTETVRCFENYLPVIPPKNKCV